MALFGWLLGLMYGPDDAADRDRLRRAARAARLAAAEGRPRRRGSAPSWARCSGARRRRRAGGGRGGGGGRLSRDRGDRLRGRPLVRIMAEEVPASELRYVVPFEARSRYVGADYVEQLAKVRGGTFRRNPPDVGILASLDSLDGPRFDPGRVHPLIREFYEHTSRFRLSIVPEWRRVDEARLRGLQAAGRRAARPGRDPVEHPGGPARHGQHDRHDRPRRRRRDRHRGWIRTFADTGKPIYVGIYTSFRHEDRGYVSVGFPIPSANFTATLRAAERQRARAPADVAQPAPVPRPLPELGRQRTRRPDRAQAAVLPGARSRLRRRRRAEDRPQLLARRPAIPDAPLRDRAGSRPSPREVGNVGSGGCGGLWIQSSIGVRFDGMGRAVGQAAAAPVLA